MTIAIDGFSSTGKSTLAKQIAKHLGYIYVDSGAMYRAVTLYAMQNGWITHQDFNKKGLVDNINNIALDFKLDSKTDKAQIHLNGINVENVIRSLEVSQHVSKIAAVPEVRQKLVALQKSIGENKNIVMDGRDIGTVVFPNAALKIFMTASPEIRAKRRYKELLINGDLVNYDAVLENVIQRDHMDSTRVDSPLVKAADAVEFDNSNMTMEEQFKNILELVTSTINKKK